jgi:hypothetical protein
LAALVLGEYNASSIALKLNQPQAEGFDPAKFAHLGPR